MVLNSFSRGFCEWIKVHTLFTDFSLKSMCFTRYWSLLITEIWWQTHGILGPRCDSPVCIGSFQDAFWFTIYIGMFLVFLIIVGFENGSLTAVFLHFAFLLVPNFLFPVLFANPIEPVRNNAMGVIRVVLHEHIENNTSSKVFHSVTGWYIVKLFSSIFQ